MKVYLDTIGCRLNQSEIEKFARQFRAAGHQVVSNAGEADIVVVNTCAVTAQAASDSRQKVRQAARAGHARVVVTGCWSTLEPKDALGLPGVTRVVPNLEKDMLVPDLLELPAEAFDLEPIARQPLPGAHQRTRAFIKVQDGCDNHCSFCVTRIARGPGRSRTRAEVLQDVQAALDGGAQEVVLTGVHLGSWGQDFSAPSRLQVLIEDLLAHTNAPRLRLSSLEPWDLDETFFSLWQDDRMCRHLHLPLQSGSAATLRRMVRKTRPDLFMALVEAARRAAENIAITTDLIVGFPGETAEEFSESLDFVRAVQFAGGHVFHYSGRPGTAATRLPGQVPLAVSKARSAVLRGVLDEARYAYQRQFIGQDLPVLWESCRGIADGRWMLEGLSGNYLRVTAPADQPRWNQIDTVRLEQVTQQGMAGQIL